MSARKVTNPSPAIVLVVLMSAMPLIAQGPPPPPPPLPPVPVPVQNPITESKRVLGKILFWDEQLSSDNTVACGTCHRPGSGGTDPRQSANPGLDGVFGTPDDVQGSPGVARATAANDYLKDSIFGFQRQVTKRRAPDFTGAAYSPSAFWDGRALGTFLDPITNAVLIPNGGALESQSVGPIVGSSEMAHDSRLITEATTKLAVVKPLKLASNIPADMANAVAAHPTYASLFQSAFGDPAITAARIAFSIATYERTLVPNQTANDAWAGGNQNALNQQQLQGFNAFNTVGRCNQCHTGPTFTDNAFHNLGLRPVAEDTGRQQTTLNINDRGKFKTPSLRNAALRPRSFHNGAIAGMPNTVGFYGGGGGPNLDNRDPILNGSGFPPQVGNDIVAFLGALIDPRAQAGTFPFDRPTLSSEGPPINPQIYGPATIGSGFFAPAMLATAPLVIDNPDWKIGVGNAKGGAFAYLVASSAALVPAQNLNGLLLNIDPNQIITYVGTTLTGAANGTGVATFHLPLAHEVSLIGLQVRFQWVIADPGANGGVSGTPGAALTIF